MKTALALIALLSLSGCYTPPHDPIVDMSGVEQARYNADLADCVKNGPLTWGNPITRCMKKKGYTILVSYDAFE